jgi:uncharacterized protein with HEPN domain
VKDLRVLVLHALECIGRVEKFTAVGEREFHGSDLIQGAVLHNLQTMAQSIMQLPEAFKASHREVDWRSLVGFRTSSCTTTWGSACRAYGTSCRGDLPAVKVALEAMRRELEDA